MTRVRNKIKSLFTLRGKFNNHTISKSILDSDIPPGEKLLTGKNVIITGAGPNIGRGIASEMAKQGANIFFTEIDSDRLSALKKELSEIGVSSRGFLSDISNVEDIDRLVQKLNDEAISIDVLINNAAYHSSITSISEIVWEDIDKTYKTNVFGPLYLTKLVSKQMRENPQGGSIIFISSVHQSNVSRFITYGSSKASIGMIIKELAIELASHNIRVNGIAPGEVREDEHGETRPSIRNPLHKSTIHPKYIGRAAVYLASEYYSHFTTGSILTIDAGLSLYNKRVEECPPG